MELDRPWPMNILAPPDRVLEEFGAVGRARPLFGGRGASWQCGRFVLKPVDMPVEALSWLDEVVRREVRTNVLRLSFPCRSRSGRLVVDGWTAFPFLAGSHQRGRWLEIIAAGEALAEVLRGVERPRFIEARDDSWARADRAAWGEEDVEGLTAAPHLGALLDARRPVPGTSQLVHGDLSGNVLFHPTLPPAIIDLSLYWRPSAYGSAIVLTDAICFERAGFGLVEEVDTGAHVMQYVLRALVFRMGTDFLQGGPTHGGSADPYAALAELVLAATGSESRA